MTSAPDVKELIRNLALPAAVRAHSPCIGGRAELTRSVVQSSGPGRSGSETAPLRTSSSLHLEHRAPPAPETGTQEGAGELAPGRDAIVS